MTHGPTAQDADAGGASVQPIGPRCPTRQVYVPPTCHQLGICEELSTASHTDSRDLKISWTWDLGRWIFGILGVEELGNLWTFGLVGHMWIRNNAVSSNSMGKLSTRTLARVSHDVPTRCGKDLLIVVAEAGTRDL